MKVIGIIIGVLNGSTFPLILIKHTPTTIAVGYWADF